ncbi:MAG: HlyC/CorC family transporter [Planctomycetia bacterium]|nr:HlyC/CorC family transporter [Planctomycetia bacterium]
MSAPGSLGFESALLLLLLASVAAVQARAVRGAQRHRVQELCRQRGCPERYDEIVAGSETIAFVAASIVVIAAVVATLLVSRTLWRVSGDGRSPPSSAGLAAEVSALAGWMAFAWLVLVVVPMLVTKFAGPRIVVATWGAWRPVVRLTSPVVGLLGLAASALGRMLGRRGPEGAAERPQDELRLVVNEAHREGMLEDAAREMIQGVIDLDEVRVSQIMTPRTGMISIPLATPWQEAVQMAAESGHTRLPVWGRSPDDVVGILHTRELLTKLAGSIRVAPGGGAVGAQIEPLLRTPYFVPESMSVQKLLREFQRTHTHMAVVTDEFGGVSGVVTIEDALEEIVGEIADEHDEAFSDGIRMLSADACESLARVHIADINERMGLSLPEETDFETIGGFVFHRCGRIPEVGERIESDGVVIEVLAATRRRVERVRIERVSG